MNRGFKQWGNGERQSVVKPLRNFVRKFLFRASRSKPPNNTLTIFNFHGILDYPLTVPDCCFIELNAFKKHLAFIQKSYTVVSLDSGVKTFMSGSFKKPLAMISFDDGYASLVRLVLPFLKETSLPVSCFINSDMIDSDATFWFCQINQMISETKCGFLDWNGRHHDLGTLSKRARASHALQESLKYLPSEKLIEELSIIATRLETDISRAVDVTSPFRVLSRAQINEAVDSGLVEFGGHTRSHAILSRLSRGQQEVEILANIEAIRTLTGQTVEIFAYPNGRSGDYDENSIQVLHEAGIKAAFTTDFGRCEKGADMYRLPRVFVGPDATEDDLLFL